MPGLAKGVMRGGGLALAWLRGKKVGADEVVLAGMFGTSIATAAAAVVLHRLTLRLFPSRPPSFALLTSLLWLLAPARATLHAVPYTEPFAALCTFGGMLLFSSSASAGRKRWRWGKELGAALCWAMGSLFRAQGATLLAGLLPFVILSFVSVAPFLLFERYIHGMWCTDAGRRPWCDEGLGMSYGWIQREYWSIRPFAYWRPLQLPNFALASPVFLLSYSASSTFYLTHLPLVLRSTLPFLPSSFSLFSRPPPPPPASAQAKAREKEAEQRIPFVHLSTALSLLLLTTAHVQIALRVCVCDPVLWWRAAELVSQSSRLPFGLEALQAGREGEGEREYEKQKVSRDWGARWVRYVVWWGTLSVVLWAVHLPPA
ncbi:ER membrane glycoprotein subunit of the GPI transamidase complex-like protein [Rhodosporidiobolus nylandii]